MKAIFTILTFGILILCQIKCIETANAVQIITPENHIFKLNSKNLEEILERGDIKDRYVVVVSIAGPLRKGKSFLLNFKLKYLNAKYKKHDITDWIGENATRADLDGFKWRGGQKPETTGIWMWSEVFTHDFENGDKVAIILLDTQGIFDDRSSMKDCISIFSISMMLSSVQCYNVMQNIQEDDLQHLELFTEYGRLALEQTDQAPFQNLLFIVRDWPYAFETNYGYAQEFIGRLLDGNDKQTSDMRELRKRIRSSFGKISAFLMPYPGHAVAKGKNFNGNLQEIDADFIKYVKILVPSLLAPENLVVKKINGERVRARDLVTYLETYVEIFNGGTLPEAKTIFTATAEASILVILNDCLNLYVDFMQKSLNEVSSYHSQSTLQQIHQNAKTQSLSMFQEKQKLGGTELISKYQQQLEKEIDARYQMFEQDNKRIQRSYKEREQLKDEIKHFKGKYDSSSKNELYDSIWDWASRISVGITTGGMTGIYFGSAVGGPLGATIGAGLGFLSRLYF